MSHGFVMGSNKSTDRNKFKDFRKVMKGITLSKTFNASSLTTERNRSISHKKLESTAQNGSNININILINGGKTKQSIYDIDKQFVNNFTGYEKLKTPLSNPNRIEENGKSHKTMLEGVMKKFEDTKLLKAPRLAWVDKTKVGAPIKKRQKKN